MDATQATRTVIDEGKRELRNKKARERYHAKQAAFSVKRSRDCEAFERLVYLNWLNTLTPEDRAKAEAEKAEEDRAEERSQARKKLNESIYGRPPISKYWAWSEDAQSELLLLLPPHIHFTSEYPLTTTQTSFIEKRVA